MYTTLACDPPSTAFNGSKGCVIFPVCALKRLLHPRSRSECVRLKNFVTGAIIINNVIENCGVYDYELGEGEKNGEGVYIGTADNQVLETSLDVFWPSPSHYCA